MKILFLDCDGVINNQDTFSKYKDADFPIDKYMAFLVGKIKLDTDCEVVLSSSWRHSPGAVEFINKRIVPIFDITPEGETRGDEINEWLEDHPDVEKYAIIDDDDDMLDDQMENFFETDFETGLTKEIADAVIKHLNS